MNRHNFNHTYYLNKLYHTACLLYTSCVYIIIHITLSLIIIVLECVSYYLHITNNYCGLWADWLQPIVVKIYIVLCTLYIKIAFFVLLMLFISGTMLLLILHVLILIYLDTCLLVNMIVFKIS